MNKSASTQDCLGLIPTNLGITADQVISDLENIDYKPSAESRDAFYLALSCGLEYRDALSAIKHLLRARSAGEDGPGSVLGMMLAFNISASDATDHTLELVSHYGEKGLRLMRCAPMASVLGFKPAQFVALLTAADLEAGLDWSFVDRARLLLRERAEVEATR